MFRGRWCALGTVRKGHARGRQQCIALTPGVVARLPLGEEFASLCADKCHQPSVHARDDSWI